MRRKGRVIGALNLLNDKAGQFTGSTRLLLRQFGAHVAVAIENARLFERNASTPTRSRRSPRSAARWRRFSTSTCS